MDRWSLAALLSLGPLGCSTPPACPEWPAVDPDPPFDTCPAGEPEAVASCVASSSLAATPAASRRSRFRAASASSSSSSATQSVPVRRHSAAGGSRSASASHSARLRAGSASCAGESSMTTTCPMPAAVAPPPGNRASTRVTRAPARTSASAEAVPTMPPPTTVIRWFMLMGAG